MRHLANGLCVTRIGLAAAIVAVASHPALAWWLYLAAICSDYLDGFIARSLGTESVLGARLDHAADVILAAAALICLRLSGWLPDWGVATIMAAVAAGYGVGRRWEAAWVRLGLGVAVLGLYWTLIVGFIARAYGWHSWYIGVMASLSAAVIWLYRRRLAAQFVR